MSYSMQAPEIVVEVDPRAERAMTEARTALLIHHPFVASILMEILKTDWSITIPTAATNGKTLWFNPDYFMNMSLPERVAVIAHEVLHCVFMHMPRARHFIDIGFDGEPFIPKLWNVATDYIINDTIVKSNIGRLPGGVLHEPTKYTSESLADDVYRELYKQLPPKNREDGGGKDSQDEHVYDSTNPVDENEMKQAVASAAANAKAVGKMPAALERFVGELLDPQIPWQEKLRAMIVRAVGRDALTWARAHRRRLVTQGVYMPAATGFHSGIIAVAIDTSGSIGERELTAFASELSAIVNDCAPEMTYVIWCDAQVAGVDEVGTHDELLDAMKNPKGGGGTDFRPPFAWLSEQGIEPQCFVYLTDLYGPFPEEAPSYQTIWCSTTKQLKAPFGETLYIDIKG